MSKHTPGLWIWIFDPYMGTYDRLVDKNGEVIIEQATGVSGEGYATAEGIDISHDNARLIAAAPDLLEACKAAMKSIMLAGLYLDDIPVEHLSTFNEGFAKLQAAIIEAEGIHD